MQLPVSLGQMRIRLGDPEANFEQMSAWTREAAKQGSTLVLFPELWFSGYDLEHCQSYAARLGEGIFARLSKLARDCHIAIGGSVLESKGGNVYNTFHLFDSSGQCSAVYRKIHLFGPMQEDKWLAPGDQLELAQTPWGLAGLSICYDLRFPEVFRHYTLRGARLILLVAEWPISRIDHWQTLLRARAIENQVYIAACNCAGMTGGEKFGGCSAVIDPLGKVVIDGGSAQALLTAEIDLDLVEETRQRLPFFRDRRPDLYSLGNL